MKVKLLLVCASLGLIGCDDSLARRLDALETKVERLESRGGPGYVDYFSDLQQSFTPMNDWGERLVDLSPPVSKVRIFARMRTGATDGDLIFQCDTDPIFGSATTCARIDDPGAGRVSSDWTPLRGADCTDASAWCRFGMSGGNGAEDPVVKSCGYDLKMDPAAVRGRNRRAYAGIEAIIDNAGMPYPNAEETLLRETTDPPRDDLPCLRWLGGNTPGRLIDPDAPECAGQPLYKR